MPQIVTYDQRTQTPSGGADTPVPTPGATIGDALEKLGDQGEETFGQVAHLHNQDAAKRADVVLTQKANDLLYGGDTPFMGLQGDEAVQAAEPTAKALHQLYDQAAAGLNPAARRMFDTVAQDRLQGWRAGVMKQAIDQRTAAFDRVSASRQQASAQDYARNLVAADPAEAGGGAMAGAAASLASVASEAFTSAERQGLPPQERDQAVRQARADAVGQAVKSLTDAAKPDRALALFDTHKEDFDPQAFAAWRPLLQAHADQARIAATVSAVVAARQPAPPAAMAAALPPDAHPLTAPHEIVQAAIDAAGPEAEHQAMAAQAAMAQLAQIRVQRTQQVRARTDDLHQAMIQGGLKAMAGMSPAQGLALPLASQPGLRRFQAAGGFAEFSDPLAHGELYGLAADDPRAFLDHDLTGTAADLSGADFAQAVADQRTLRQGGPQAEALLQGLVQARAATNQSLAEIGIDPADHPEVSDAAFSQVKRAVDAHQAANAGKRPDPAQLADIRDQVMAGGTWAQAPGSNGEAADIMRGGGGDDTLKGGSGDDRMSGLARGDMAPSDGDTGFIRVSNPASPTQVRVERPAVRSKPVYDSVAGLDFAIKNIGMGAQSKYGFLGVNKDARGRLTDRLAKHGVGGVGDFKCNLFVHDVQLAAGVDARLEDGAIPRAENWHDPGAHIYARAGGKVVGEYVVVATGDMTDQKNLRLLRPGDITANSHHVGIYTPYVRKEGEAPLSGYSKAEIKDIGASGSLADGEAYVEPHTISAATRDGDDPHLVSDALMLNSGVVWNLWGFRPGEEKAMVARRFVPKAH